MDTHTKLYCPTCIVVGIEQSILPVISDCNAPKSVLRWHDTVELDLVNPVLTLSVVALGLFQILKMLLQDKQNNKSEEVFKTSRLFCSSGSAKARTMK